MIEMIEVLIVTLSKLITDLNILDLIFGLDLDFKLLARQCRYRQPHSYFPIGSFFETDSN